MLEPEGRIQGKAVLYESRKPAGGIQVHAVNYDYFAPGSDTVTTDKKGFFTISNLATGVYNLKLVNEKQFPNWVVYSIAAISVEQGKTVKNKELQLIEGGIIKGRITDTGEPLTGITVSIQETNRGGRQHFGFGLIDKNGDYHIRSVPGKVNVNIHPVAGYVGNKSKEEFEVKNGKTINNKDFQFKKGLNISGKVFGPDGKPVSGDAITKSFPGSRRTPIISDNDGSFNLSGLFDGKPIIVEAVHKERRLRTQTDFEISEGADMEIHLNPYETATVEGRFIDEQGIPLHGIPIEYSKSYQLPGMYGMAVSKYIAAVTDDSGYFRVSDLVIANDQSLLANAKGYKLMTIQTLDKAKPGLNNLGDIILGNEHALRWIDGTIVDSDGNPVVGARAHINGRYPLVKDVFTDGQGNFRFDGLKPKIESQVTLKHKDFGFFRFNYIVTNQSHTFILYRPISTILGKVTGADGNPPEHVYFSIGNNYYNISPKGKIYTRASTNNLGEFTIDDLIYEPVTLIADNPEHR